MADMRNVYVSFIFIASGGLLYGYSIGINGNVVTSGQLVCPDGWEGAVGTYTTSGYQQCYILSDLEQGFFSCLNLIGACLSSLVCFRYSDTIGRKLEVQVAAALYIAGAVIAAASPVLWGVYVGFVVYGLGIGFAMHAAPVYIAEISPADIRGRLISAKECVVVLGMFLGFFFGFIFSGIDELGWRFMVIVSLVLAMAQGIGITCIPQSPRFLLLKALSSKDNDGLTAEAHASLQFFRRGASPSDIDHELQIMKQEILESSGKEAEAAKCTDPFRFPKPLIIGCGLVFLQQVTGQPSVLYFATDIFKAAGLGSDAAVSSVAVGLVKLLATLFTVWRVDQYGRRRLLFVGISMMAVALAIICTAFLFRECQVSGVSLADCPEADLTLPSGWAVATIGGLMIYVSGYQVSFGPICWLMIAEVFPLRVRGAALSLAAIVNFGSNIMMTLTQEVLLTTLTPSGDFFGYFVLTIASLVFVKLIVPETKGKTLEEIERMLAGGDAIGDVSKLSQPNVNGERPAV